MFRYAPDSPVLINRNSDDHPSAYANAGFFKPGCVYKKAGGKTAKTNIFLFVAYIVTAIIQGCNQR